MTESETSGQGNAARAQPLRHALVVDDEAPLLRLIARVLERADFVVETAADGEEALRVFGLDPPAFDLVVLDVVLPGMGAVEVLPALLEARPDLRVILTSGDELPEELESRIASIDGHFLRKPFAPPALLRLVDAAGGASAGVGG